MKNNIIYITFIDFEDQKSGSSVRPKKIYDAFLEEGYNVSLLKGQQNRKLERWKACFKFFKEIKNKKYEFCYVEPPAGPIFNLCDHLLLLYISKVMKVPVGLFYRDAYWKFADWYEVKGLKKFIINTMHKFDWKVIKSVCRRVYFPTKTMGDLFDFPDKMPLPPGAEKISVDKKSLDEVELIYVGGVSEQYGGTLLLQAMEEVNKVKKINLHLVCREEEVKKIEEYKDKEWLSLYHASGSELKEIYSKANVAIIPRKVDFYMDFAMPVKLFEYISYELPIISTNCKEVAKFINENNIGFVCEDNVQSLVNTLLNIDMNKINEVTENVKLAKENNTWNSRVKEISKLK